jgi:Zn finger protein HypA/HybF involved in hydrogenase expression
MALQQQQATENKALKKRVAELEKRVAELEAPQKAAQKAAEEEAAAERLLASMSEAEMMAWAEKAAAAITHITELGVCSKCKKSAWHDVPNGQWKYTVTCPHCKHAEEKTRF